MHHARRQIHGETAATNPNQQSERPPQASGDPRLFVVPYTYLVVRRDGVDDDGDEYIDEDKRGHHDVAQKKRDRHRRVRSAANHVRRGALAATTTQPTTRVWGGGRNHSTARKSRCGIERSSGLERVQ